MFSTKSPARRHLLNLLAVALPTALLVVQPTSAGAATKDAHPEVVQCFTDFPPAGCADVTPAGLTPVDVEISSDGKQLYVLGADGTVLIVDRAASGVVTPRTGPGSCFNDLGDKGCTGLDGLGGDATDLTLSDDGTSVYVASSGAVASLTRSAATGDLAPSTCYSAGSAGCTLVSQLAANVSAVVVSPGSANVYARSAGRLLAFDRTAATGLLTLKAGNAGCYTEVATAGCADKVGLVGGGVEMAASPDGGSLYVPNDGGIAVFSRIAGGALDQVAGPSGGCITVGGTSTGANECQDAGGPGGAIELAFGATISPSGKHVFISGNDGSGAFSRNASTGLLTLTDCLSRQSGVPGCLDADGVAGGGVEVSPDGTRAIIGGGDVGGFGVWDFDDTAGRFTQLPGPEGCYSGSGAFGCTPIPGGFLGKSVWAPDGLNAYVVPRGNLLNVLQDHAPVCQPVSLTVPTNTPTAVPLACTDANGDSLTIATSGSAHGTVGAVDQGAHTAVYTPAAGYAGGDSFTFTATGGGRTSAPATVSITVPASPVPPPAADTSVTLTIKGGTLKLTRGKAKVKLTCPATEQSGPCAGKLTMKTRGKVPVDNLQKVVVLAAARYSIPAGTSKKVVLKVSTKSRVLLLTVGAARKLRLVATVRDAVGNKATVKAKAQFKLP